MTTIVTKEAFLSRLYNEEVERQKAAIEARRQKFLPTAQRLGLAGNTVEEWRTSASEILATESDLAEACREASRARIAIEARIAADERRNQADLQAADGAIAKANLEWSSAKDCRPFIADTSEAA